MKITNILLVFTLCLFNAKTWSQEVPAGDTAPSAETSPAPEAPAPEAPAPEAKAPEAKAPEAKAPEAKTPAAKAPEAKTPAAKTPAAKAPEAAPADPEVSPDNGSNDEGSIDEGNADEGSSDEGSIDDGNADQGSSEEGKVDEGSSTESGKKPESSKTPEASKGPTSRDQAEESAAREIGRVIGNKIGQDAVSKMKQVDRKALLERTRTALRGEILRKYAFSESPYMNSFVGTMMVLREGKDYAGFKCKELEIDLVYKVQRIYSKPVLCQEANGEWSEVDPRNVIFPRRGEPTPGRSSGNGPNKPGKGGWLPPL